MTAAVPARARWSAWFWRAVGVAVLLTVWQLIALAVYNLAVLPAPIDVVENLVRNFGGSAGLAYLGLSETSYLGNLRYTAGIVLTAWLVGSALGLSGVVAARLQWVRDLTDPVLYVFGVVPVVVAAPFALIWFGFGPVGQWILVAFFSYVTVAVASLAAALRLAPRYEEYAATLGVAMAARLRTVVLPAVAPATSSAVRVALGAAWSLQVVAELFGSETGVGRVIAVRAKTGDVPSVMAVIIVLGLVALVCDLAVARLAKRSGAWQ
ncbi:ABC transporter permease [Pseudonocardia ailaonensis]|uniref:ABC transporter permease n=1 Tax=Pseudonocardia ailaonensis TaxID=367279 RepID=A0ABN2MS05_9PSEU